MALALGRQYSGLSGRVRRSSKAVSSSSSSSSSSFSSSDLTPRPSSSPFYDRAGTCAAAAQQQVEFTRQRTRQRALVRDVETLPKLPYELDDGVEQGLWFWREKQCNIRYQKAGSRGPAVILIHGFGGNCDHWRKNIGPLSEFSTVYSIDLLGYGYSDKPCPVEYGETNSLYNFYVWADQLNGFVDEVVHAGGEKCDVVLVCNSVGSCAGLQAIADRREEKEDFYKGIMLLNPSLRLLHTTKQAWFAKPFVKLFQDFLRESPAGQLFFKQVAQPKAIENILKEAYHNEETVSSELVNVVLNPGLQPGAVRVFLDFLSYSGGPLPEELIPKMPCPVELVWGAEDPWESIDIGRETLGCFDTVSNFHTLENVGHCPMDEAPEKVNPLIKAFLSEVSEL